MTYGDVALGDVTSGNDDVIFENDFVFDDDDVTLGYADVTVADDDWMTYVPVLMVDSDG